MLIGTTGSKRKHSTKKRAIAAAIAICFLFNSIAYGQIPSNIRLQPIPQIQIPSHLGSIEAVNFSAAAERPLLIHIQDAHSNPEGQRNTAEIIRYLAKTYGIRKVFVEGAVENLDSKYLQFIPDNNLNQKLIQKLVDLGEITGAELALGTSGVQFIGIEDVSAYRKNFDLFRNAMKQESINRKFLKSYQHQLDQKASRVLGKDALQLFRHYLSFDKKDQNWIAVTADLQRSAKRSLNRDLSEAKEQIEFPNLVRLFQLKAEEGKINFEQAQAEEIAIQKKYGSFSGANFRGQMEMLYQKASPLGFKFASYPHFTSYIRNQIFQQEIEAAPLFDEIRQLMDLLLSKILPADIVREARNFKLLEGLLNLELTHAEWSEVSQIHFEGPGTDAAKKFYEAAIQRESVFMKKIEAQLHKSKDLRAIVITGGFHTNGMNRLFDEHQMPHLTIRPKVENDSSKLYRRGMMHGLETSEVVLAQMAQSRSALAASLGENVVNERMKLISAEASSLGEAKRGEGSLGTSQDFVIPKNAVDFLNSLGMPGLKKLFQDAAQAMKYTEEERPLDSRGKPGAVLNVLHGKNMIVAGDLQGHFYHLTALLKEPGVMEGLHSGTLHLAFLGDLIHPSGELMLEEDAQAQTLATLALFMQLKVRFPKNIHTILGNHELSHVTGSGFSTRKSPPGDKQKVNQTKQLNDFILDKYGHHLLNGIGLLGDMANFFASLPLMIRVKTGNDFIVLLHAQPPIVKGGLKELNDALVHGYYYPENGVLNRVVFSRRANVAVQERFLKKYNFSAVLTGHTPPTTFQPKENIYQLMKKGRFGVFGFGNLILDAQERPDFGYVIIGMDKDIPRRRDGKIAIEMLKDSDGKSSFRVAETNGHSLGKESKILSREDQLAIVGMAFHGLNNWLADIHASGTLVPLYIHQGKLDEGYLGVPIQKYEKEHRDLSNLSHQFQRLINPGIEGFVREESIDSYFLKIWEMLLLMKRLIQYHRNTVEKISVKANLTESERFIKSQLEENLPLEERIDKLIKLVKPPKETGNGDKKIIDIRKIIETAEGLFKDKETSQSHQINLVMPNEELPARVSALGMIFVFENLIRNAKKYDATQINIEASHDSNFNKVVILVSNNGRPITKDRMKLLFKRGESEDKNRPEGGMGLVLSQSLLQSYGGDMELLSQADQSPVFRIELPYTKVSAASLGSARPSGTAVALGGNAMIAESGLRKGDRSKEAQFENMKEMLRKVLKLYQPGEPLLITHGNGPQVGDLSNFYQELYDTGWTKSVPKLDRLVGATQRQIFNDFVKRAYDQIKKENYPDLPELYLNETRVIVDPADEAFGRPDKPIGPYYSENDKINLEAEKGWKFIHIPNRGFRRVVASPKPISIAPKDLEVIRRELAAGKIVIAVGGGGIPVRYREGDKQEELEGVIDKDRSTALLAKQLNLKNLLIITGVPRVKVGYGTSSEKELSRPSIHELKKYFQAGEFPPGSMGPKVEAVLDFAESGMGRRGIITDVENIENVFQSYTDSGTIVTAGIAAGASLGKMSRRNFLKLAAAGGGAGLVYTLGTKFLTEAQDGARFEPNRESYRFAPKYPRADLLTSADSRNRFIREYLTNEGKFHQPGVSYNGVSGLTYDGHSIDSNSGELTGAPRNWSASSKESLHVGLLALAVLNEDERVKLFIAQDNPTQAAERALDILTKKISSYEKFNRDFPGFGGFLPWFLVTDGGMQPTHDWQDRVPALDNGQLAWSLYLTHQVLKEKGHDDLARRYKAQFDLMVQNALKIFYEADGKIRGEVRIRDTRANPARENYSKNADFYLEDPFEGELMTFFMVLFGDWTSFGGAPEAEKIWRFKRRNMESINFQTPRGQITVQKGNRFSAHELWKYLVLPYVNDPTARKIFENGEKARTWYSAMNQIPGLFAAAHGPVSGNENPTYVAELGIPPLARFAVERQDIVAPYAAFPVILAGPNGIGTVWLHAMLSANRMQGPFGSSESTNVEGTQIAPILTWDVKVTTVAAMLGGFHQQIARYLRLDGKLDRFLEIVRREHQAVFTDIKGENIPFASPAAEIPKAISDFSSGRSLGDTSNPGKIKFQIMPDKKALAKEVALRIVEVVKKNPRAVLGLATGGTMEDVYKEVIELFKSDTKIDFSKVVTFNLDEYLGLSPTNPQSYRAYMEKHLFRPLREKHLDEAFQKENTFVFDGLTKDPEKEIDRYLNEIRKRGGIDFQLLGIGKDGHFAFVEPAPKPDTLEKIRDFNEFMMDENLPEQELSRLISEILKKRMKARSELAAFPDLLKQLEESRKQFFEARGADDEANIYELKTELNIFGRRLLDQQDTIFYISDFTEAKAQNILEQIPEMLRRHVLIKDRGEFFGAGAKLVSLAIPTLLDNGRYYENINAMKLKALTLAGEVRKAREILLAATGEKKAAAIRDSFSGPISSEVTSSIFQLYDNTTFIIDPAAASLIQASAASLGTEPKWVLAGNKNGKYDPELVEALMRLSHPSIPKFRKNDLTGNYEIKWVEGRRWFDWIDETSQMSGEDFLKQIVAWTIQIGEALKLVHDSGHIHGDIRIENIQIEPETNNPVLIDWDDLEFRPEVSKLRELIPDSAEFRDKYIGRKENISDPELTALLKNDHLKLDQFVSELKKYSDHKWPDGASLGQKRPYESKIHVAVEVTKNIFAKEDVLLLGDVLDVLLRISVAHANVQSPVMVAPGISADQLALHLIRKVILQTLPDGPVAIVVTESMKEDYLKALKDVIREGDLIVAIDNPQTAENILPLLRSITHGKKVIVKSLATASPLAAELEMKLKGYSARFSLEDLNDSITVPTTKKELIHFEVNQKLLSKRQIDVQVVTSLLRRLAQVKDPATRRQIFEQAGLQRIDDQHWIVGEGLAQIISKLQDELAGHQATARAA